jgi:hypothetical protein
MKNYDAPKEGKVGKALQEQTAKIPSDIYLWAALGTVALSLGLLFGRRKHLSILLGQWAPSLLVIGLYNKLAKVEHDEKEKIKTKNRKKQIKSTV